MNQVGPTLHGLLLINKEPGITSHDLVARLRKILSISAVGHCGTLDPIAGGLMVMLVGEGTKLSQYILEGDKSYHLKMILGKTSDTFDSTGNILSENKVEVSVEQVKEKTNELQGEFEFPVPIFSAVKVGGQKLYEYARRSEDVQVPYKKMKFWGVGLVAQNHPEWEFSISCSKGSYIRTWIHELGGRLSCGAVMSGLTRTFSAPYSLSGAQTLIEVQEQIRKGEVPQSFIPLSKALPHVLRIRVNSLDSRLLLNGQIGHEFRTSLIQKFDPEKSEIIQAMSEDGQRLLGLIGFDKVKGFVIRRVINQF